MDLFEVSVVEGPYYDDYAVSRDGQSFLVKVPVGEQRPPRIHAVLNWSSLLQE